MSGEKRREGEKQERAQVRQKEEAREEERIRAVRKTERQDHKDKGKQRILTQHTTTKIVLDLNNNRSGTTVYTAEQLEH